MKPVDTLGNPREKAQFDLRDEGEERSEFKAALSPAPSYSAYASRQRAWLRSPEADAHREWWRCNLADLPRLNLPSDHPTPAVRDGRGDVQTFSLDSSATTAVDAFARDTGNTAFTVFLAAWSALLYHYSGDSDFAVGTPVAGREDAGLDDVLGVLVNTLPIRVGLHGETTVRQHLDRVREAVLSALEHQRIPFEEIVRVARPARGADASYGSLYRVGLVLEDERWTVQSFGGFPASAVTRSASADIEGTAKCDLTLALVRTVDGYRASIEYSTDLFEAATIRRMTEHFVVLLRDMVHRQGVRLAELSLLTEGECSQLLLEWSGARADAPVERCIHELIEDQASHTPGAVAVIFGAETLTYRELQDRAGRVAHHLGRRGVTRNSSVGLYLEPSLDLVVGFLAILKAGGVYVPLDPSYPIERLEFMIRDAGVSVLVTTSALVGSRPLGVDVGQLHLDNPVEVAEMSGPSVDGQPAKTHDPAYVIYTSGSTGRPKGVKLRHAGLANLAQSQKNIWRLRSGDRYLHCVSMGFDVSVGDMATVLGAGATLVMMDRESLADVERLAEVCRANEVTFLTVTSAMLAVLRPELFPSIRTLVVGGDVWAGHLAEKWWASSARVFNAYGPTEATVCATTVACAPGVLPPVIGRPLPNVHVYVLNTEMRPVPVGVPGELFIGGAGVAEGYVNLTELTEKRFVGDPFSSEGGRLYRTGDLVKYREDGHIEFVRRADHQLKIRGFRVEPGEIEAAIRTHPDIDDCLVLAREDAAGDKRLVAYVVRETTMNEGANRRKVDAPGGKGLDSLSAWLRERLPEFMVPSTVVVLDQWPLTANGKVDRQALLALGKESAAVGHGAARDRLELEIARIWEELLDRGPIGVEANFFDVGGHSLLAVRMLAAVDQRFGIRLRLADIVRSPTVEDIAALVRDRISGVSGRSASPVVAIRSEGRDIPFFCVHPAGGIVYCYQELAREFDSDVPFYGVEHPAVFGAESDAHLSIEALASGYVEAVRQVQPTGPYRLGGWSAGGLIAFEMACQLERGGASVENVMMLDTVTPGVNEKMESERDFFGQVAALSRAWGLEIAEDALRSLGGDAAIAHVAEKAAEAKMLPRGYGLEYVQRLFALGLAAVDVCSRFVPKAYRGRVTLLRVQGSPAREEAMPRDYGWGQHTTRPVSVYIVPGDHETMVQRPHIRELAATLRRALRNTSDINV